MDGAWRGFPLAGTHIPSVQEQSRRTFTDVTAKPVWRTRAGTGVCIGDYDNMVLRTSRHLFRKNVLYHNNGMERFPM